MVLMRWISINSQIAKYKKIPEIIKIETKIRIIINSKELRVKMHPFEISNK